MAEVTPGAFTRRPQPVLAMTKACHANSATDPAMRHDLAGAGPVRSSLAGEVERVMGIEPT